MRKGYRVAEPEENVAWKALEFEYTELNNTPTLDAVAGFLHVPITTWPRVLALFKSRYGDTEGTWLTHTPQQAIRQYGDFSGADPRTYDLGDVYQVMYDPANIVMTIWSGHCNIYIDRTK